MYVHIYTHMYIYVYIYIYIHVHTYTYTHTNSHSPNWVQRVERLFRLREFAQGHVLCRKDSISSRLYFILKGRVSGSSVSLAEFKVAVCYSVLQYAVLCCRVLQCGAVCCSVLLCDAVCCSAAMQYSKQASVGLLRAALS